MKRIVLLSFLVGLVGCSQSELEKLKSDQTRLEKKVEQLNKEAEKPSAECQKSLKLYEDAVAKNSKDSETLRKSGAEICQKAFDISNEALRVQGEIVNLQLAIIAEEISKKEKDE